MGRKKSYAGGIAAGVVLLLVFAAFTYLAMSYDVQAIGINGSPVGFGTINAVVNSMFPFSSSMLGVSDFLGYIALGLAAVNCLVALIDLIACRGIGKMHRRYIVTAVFYFIVLCVYIGFELFVVNCRPNSYEASYPSSHTILALCIFSSTIVLLGYAPPRMRIWCDFVRVFCLTACICMPVFRLLSGVHWLTDIIGAVILSLGLVLIYRSVVRRCEKG